MAAGKGGQPRKLTPAKRRQIVELAEHGVGRNEIARRLHLRRADVTAIATDAGLAFDRSETSAGLKARKVDLADRRARQLERIYDIVDQTLDRLEDKAPLSVLKGEGGVESEVPVGKIPARDLLQISNSLASQRKTATDLERIDNPAADSAASLLTNLAGRLGLDDTAEPTGGTDG